MIEISHHKSERLQYSLVQQKIIPFSKGHRWAYANITLDVLSVSQVYNKNHESFTKFSYHFQIIFLTGSSPDKMYCKNTDGSKILHTLLVKHYNDLLCVLHKNDFLCNPQSLELFPRNLRKHFFLKIGILSPKVYTKNVPNIEVCNFILALLRTLSIKQVIVVLY